MQYEEREDKVDLVSQMRAASMVKRMNEAAIEILQSSFDKKLAQEVNPYERAGAYILHSINVLIQAGETTEELLERHAYMVQMLTEIKSDYLKSLDESSKR